MNSVQLTDLRLVVVSALLRTYNLQLKASLDVQRLQLRIHQEGIIEVRHFAPPPSEHRKQPRRERLVPFHCQARPVSNNQRKLVRADVSGQRNGMESPSAHRRITEQRINRNMPL